MVRWIKILTGIMMAIAISSCCDTCDTIGSSGDGNSQNAVIFSALPFNSNSPAIYESNIIGNSIRLITENAQAFSAPALNGKIAFLRTNNEGISQLFTIQRDGTNETFITQDNQIFKISNPIISHDGGKIAFVSFNTRLIVYDIANTVFNQISDRLSNLSSPVFSPDGNYLAYIESDANNANPAIKIIDANNTNNINYIYQGVITNHNAIAIPKINLNWSDNSDYISHAYANNNTNFINVINIKSNKTDQYEIPKDNFDLKFPIFSSIKQLFVFSSKDGNLWTRNLSLNSSRYTKLTTVFENEKNIAPKWSEDSNNLLFLNNYSPDGELSSLFILNIKKTGETAEVTKSTVISNNCLNAFWFRK